MFVSLFVCSTACPGRYRCISRNVYLYVSTMYVWQFSSDSTSPSGDELPSSVELQIAGELTVTLYIFGGVPH